MAWLSLGLAALSVPGGALAEGAPPALAAAANPTHEVAAGETVFRIARRYGTSVEEIIRANRITDVRRVRPGVRLVIPTQARAQTAAAAPAPQPETAPAPAPPARATSPVSPPASSLPAQPRSWVLGAAQVVGPGLAELRPPLATDAWGRPIPHPLVASPSTQTIEFRAQPEGEDVLHQIEIEHGKSVFLRADYTIKRVSVGNPEIVDVVVLSTREIQLVAKSVGGTNVILWDPGGRPQAAIDVHVGTVHSNLQSLLRKVLPGEDIQVESAGSGIALRGEATSAVAMDQALSVARAFLGEDEKQLVNLIALADNQQVMLKVVVAEMSRSLERELGSNWNAIIETDGKVIALTSFLEGLTSPGAGGGVVLSDLANLVGSFQGLGSLSLLQVFLDLVERKGLAKILAEPTLVARSGETASFLVGGEVPIPIAQGGAFGSITVEFKDFGIAVGFTPTVLGPDRIHLEVSPEVSEPDFNFGTEVDGTVVPGFITRRASTSVELADGQSFVIAGLLSDTVRELAGYYPVLGRIPVLGALFRSSQFQKNETELVIIVTPQLVKPLGPGPHPLPTDPFIEPDALEFFLLYTLEGRGSGGSGALDEPRSGGLIGDAGHRVVAEPEGGRL